MVKLIQAAVRAERGSALLMSLMVMVGLSLLGLGFVAISETENAISINQRNAAQTQALAEAGARVVVEWFQRPEWAGPLGLMPSLLPTGDDDPLKRTRVLDPDGPSGSNPVMPVGEHKDLTSDPYFCCDRPFKPAVNDRFYGTEETADITIDESSTRGQTFLDTFNTTLFRDNEGGRIVEIRIFAPPILNGQLNASNFYNHNVGARYGLATIRVTARKGDAANPIAQRPVKIVISEWPFPGPQGPIQSNANIQTGGNVAVHWGKMTAQGDMFVFRPLVGIPWFDPYDRVRYEQGYDSSNQWQASKIYNQYDVVHPITSSNEAFVKLAPAAPSPSGPLPTDEPSSLNTPAIGMTFTDSAGTVWLRRTKTPYPNIDTSIHNRTDWLFELLYDGTAIKEYDDPWIEARSRGPITNAIVTMTNPHPFKYSAAMLDETGEPTAGFSNWFQYQNTNDPMSDKKEVIFPRIDYDFWKNTATSGQGNEGVYYLSWVDTDQFRDNAGTIKTFKGWTNIVTGAARGFYFFDTMNGQNPQIPGGTAFLTPAVNVQSAGGNEWTMSGFIYLNAVEYGTQGVAGPVAGDRYNYPGEPYRDVGYWPVDPATMKIIDNPLGSQNYTKVNNGNGRWDYQDVNNNGKFDLVLLQRMVTRPGDTSSQLFWLPAPFIDNCTIGTDCSEPHEPYVNLVYPLDACCVATEPLPLRMMWENPGGTITRRPKDRLTSGAWPAVNASDICTDPTQFDFCTSNGYDRNGYADLWAGGAAPVLDGVFYNEGNFNPQGNARYFGSMLINGNVDATGTNEVWFDERLIKDEWPPKSWPFPRVIITAVETEN